MAKEMDPVMAKVLVMFEKSGKTLDQLGQDMGYTGDIARKAAWQFLKKTTDPHISMLRRFAKAEGIPLEELVSDRPEKGPKK
jgi:transcriptional regulator with XRE-family HTH domain